MTNRTLLFALSLSLPTRALCQPAPTTLFIDVDQGLFYARDNPDWTRYATSRAPVAQVPTLNFQFWEGIGDIVSVNGKPVKGTWHSRAMGPFLSPTPQPGQAIADVLRSGTLEWIMEILSTEGDPIGTIMGYGWNGGSPPPGASSRQGGINLTITGGTGAYVGIRGQMGANGERAATAPPNQRTANASVLEDPSLRRVNGTGQTRRHVLQIFPLFVPEVIANEGGALALHADAAPVNATRPARAGEILAITAANLGAVRGGAGFGQPFPENAVVNSPIEVLVGGNEAEVLEKTGLPNTVNRYRVRFRMPETLTPGATTLQLRAAFLDGTPVSIPVQ